LKSPILEKVLQITQQKVLFFLVVSFRCNNK
jgi:hypothetical protein